MSIKDLLKEYLDKKYTAVQTIRIMSGMFQPEHAVDLLVIINQITRLEEGDLDDVTFKAIYKIGD